MAHSSIGADINGGQPSNVAETDGESEMAPVQIRRPKPISHPIATVLCIPVYNNAADIGPVILRATKIVDQVIVCDDASTDTTGSLYQGVGARLVRHNVRMGLNDSILDLLKVSIKADPKVIIFMDGKGSYDPSQIPDLILPILADEADFTIAAAQTPPKGVNSELDSKINAEDKLTWVNVGFWALSLEAASRFLVGRTKSLGVLSGMIAYAREIGLRVKDIQLTRRIQVNQTYEEDIENQQPVETSVKTSKNDLIDLITVQRPLLIFGLLTVMFTGAALVSGYLLTSEYLRNWNFSSPLALVYATSIFLGVSFMLCALILHALANARRR